jgi:predicted ATP-dependent endonuclease of OLD family
VKIKSVRIQNFRSFDDETIELADYTCLIGPNGAGKSNVLCALNVFFRESEGYATDLTVLAEEDFHHKNTEKPIIITLTFTDLSAEAQKDFADYFRQDQLVVSAVTAFDKATRKAEVKQYGQRLGMEAFKPFFKALGDTAKVPELKALYEAIRGTFSALPAAGTKDAMVQALRSYENNHSQDCALIPSEDQFYGISKGANRLEKYLQWVHIPAVKRATDEQMEGKNTALGKLLARTVRAKVNFADRIKTLREETQKQYESLLYDNQTALDDISAALTKRLAQWSHPQATLRLQWQQDPEKSIRLDEPWAHVVASEGTFQGELSRFGHGFQRSYLLALLQELSGSDDSGGPRLILSCEEPELYQHPPQARHLFNVLRKLSLAKSQILICTHSPYFVSGESFEDVRLVRQYDRCSRVTWVTYQDVAKRIAEVTGDTPSKPAGSLAKIHQSLQPSLSEMFFTPRLILVEGLEDLAYVMAYLHFLDLWDEYRRCGCHIVPAGPKSTMIQTIAIAKSLTIPTFVVFDSDGDKPDKQGSRAKHEKDNKGILQLCNVPSPDPFPPKSLWERGVVMWSSDIGSVVAADIGETNWKRYCEESDKMYGHAGNMHKNMLYIGTALSLAWDEGKTSTNLERLCKVLLAFGKALEAP